MLFKYCFQISMNYNYHQYGKWLPRARDPLLITWSYDYTTCHQIVCHVVCTFRHSCTVWRKGDTAENWMAYSSIYGIIITLSELGWNNIRCCLTTHKTMMMQRNCSIYFVYVFFVLAFHLVDQIHGILITGSACSTRFSFAINSM